jgi:hypothetical protein
MTYRVSFEIDVDAQSPQEACAIAWASMTSPDSFLPIGKVTSNDESEPTIEVDLNPFVP